MGTINEDENDSALCTTLSLQRNFAISANEKKKNIVLFSSLDDTQSSGPIAK